MPSIGNVTMPGPHAELYVNFAMRKLSEGQVLTDTRVYMLRNIAMTMEELRPENDKSVLPREAVLKWIEPRESEAPGTRNNRANFIRGFGRFLKDEGFDAYVLPDKLLPLPTTLVQEYIFSIEQINQVACILDSMPEQKKCPKRHVIMPMLFRVLYGCGLRISEALSLQVKDIDLNAGVIFIRKAKNHSNRIIPVSESLKAELTNYLKKMEFRSKSSAPLFPSPESGKPYTRQHARKFLQKTFAQAGILTTDGTPPRVHDLRHTFACHSLDAAAERGEDPHALVPILSKYLGHKNIQDTMRYLHLTQTSRKRIAETMVPLNNVMFPEVSYNEQ